MAPHQRLQTILAHAGIHNPQDPPTREQWQRLLTALEVELLPADLEALDLREELARLTLKAGMAEASAGLLHDVCNILNSVNVTATLIAESLRHSRLEGIGRTLALLKEHADDLPGFFGDPRKASALLAYLGELAALRERERDTLQEYVKRLSRGLDDVRTIVSVQQRYARSTRQLEPVQLEEVILDVAGLVEANLTRYGIVLHLELEEAPTLRVERHRVLMILHNLLVNACDALRNQANSTITIRCRALGGCALVEVSDNGRGVAPEHRTLLFQQGFTTRLDGNGLGLFSSKAAAGEMCGQLYYRDGGRGSGATFVLELPMQEEI